MATSYTTNVQLQKPATADRNWDVPIRANLDALDAFTAIGGLAVALAEVPSATLNVQVSAGSFRTPGGAVVAYAGTSSQAITASSTKVIYLTMAGVLTAAASYPTAPHVRLATVVAGASTITSIADNRLSLTGNPMSGRATLVAGTVTVSTAWVTTTCNIFLTTQTAGGTVGAPYVSARSAGVSFTITSTSGTDTSTVAYRSDEA